ncbi:MAG TPA: hypothetical protein VNK26_02830, partial [Pyrinomonadaceae bacterium]|nr:hypothetical protein [Pyrinomonadaceae bacterium]
VRRIGESGFNNKVELKNLNSVRFMQKAIEFEIERQIKAYENGETVEQETRLWDERTQTTRVMRSKEDAHDYRYFPEPDLQPLKVTKEFIEEIRNSLPELPDAMRDRFVETYELTIAEANLLTANKPLAEYFEETVIHSKRPKYAANWILGEFMRLLNESGKEITDSLVSAEDLAELIKIVDEGKINNNQAKEVFAEMFSTGDAPASVIEKKGFVQVSDNETISKWIEEVMKNNSEQVASYKAGNQKLFGFLVGQVMKISGGKANPKLVNEIFKKKLDE